MLCGVLGTGLAALTVAAAVAVWVALPLPPELAAPGGVPSLVLEDRYGLVLRTTRAADGSRGGWVSLEEVAPSVLQAFLAAEDHRFFEHRGVDLRAVARAARDNLRARRVVSGASTITMQAARLLRPAPRNWRGKVAQLLWALRLEAQREKGWILEQYLNRVPLGQGAVGVAAGASLYFDADPRSLSLGQATLLAALAHAPSRDNPLVDPERARTQRQRVLARMAARGYAAEEELARAALEPVLRRGESNTFLAPHFTTRLLLAGAGNAPGTAESHSGAPTATGTWRTTLDLDLQRALEAEVRHSIDLLQDRNARHAAVVVLENPTGEVLAWVGSPDFWAEEAGQVDMVASPRQPGSALKPFLFGLAFDRGYTAASVLPDIPVTYQTTTGPYQPRNYDRRFRGPVRARVALASSFNIPAVELAVRLGPGALLNTLHDAGFASLSRSAVHYGPGLALGNGDVTLLELANGFRGLANGGVWTPVRWREREGSAPAEQRRFLSRGAATLVLDILSDPSARIPGFGTETPFDLPFPAAAKTGTSRHFTDNWVIVTTGRFTLAVWVGNFSGQPMQGVSGISGAGPLAYRAALEIARRYPPGHLPTPAQAGAMATPVCILSGLRATPACPSLVEWFLPGTEPTIVDFWQRDGRTTLPPEYAEWAAAHDREAGAATITAEAATARGAAPGSPPASPPYRILSPLEGDVYEIPVGMQARYATIPLIATDGAGGIRWSINGRPVHGTRWQLAPGSHTIHATWANGTVDSVRVEVR